MATTSQNAKAPTVRKAQKPTSVTAPIQQAAPAEVTKHYQDRNLISKIWYGFHKLVDTSNLLLDRAYDITDVGSSYVVVELEALKNEVSK